MNVAISFYSEDYAAYVQKRIDDVFRDTDFDSREVGFLQYLSHDLSDAFFNYITPDDLEMDEPLDDEHQTVELVATLMAKIEKIYPTASLIGLHPVDLKGTLLAVLYFPANSDFTFTVMR